uniref:Plant intracellular Ras-group-related LRR protein 7-like n=1 Tax=Saccoglossus kowalevskii TaxID=10224 RepID=A0ABM0MVV7_SACKO|nr:PREDICTED: plant intracellular Ras-group-related LRR protein 7-like [Saccoglossus kowalevskii]
MAKIINLSGRALLSLPVDICDQKSLRSLDCKHNHLSSLPNKFRQLTNLKGLLLGSNIFTEIPLSVTKITGLVMIDISYNRLTSLPESFCDLVQLEYLDASYNHIRQLPPQFGLKLKKLKKLLSVWKSFRGPATGYLQRWYPNDTTVPEKQKLFRQHRRLNRNNRTA